MFAFITANMSTEMNRPAQDHTSQPGQVGLICCSAGSYLALVHFRSTVMLVAGFFARSSRKPEAENIKLPPDTWRMQAFYIDPCPYGVDEDTVN